MKNFSIGFKFEWLFFGRCDNLDLTTKIKNFCAKVMLRSHTLQQSVFYSILKEFEELQQDSFSSRNVFFENSNPARLDLDASKAVHVKSCKNMLHLRRFPDTCGFALLLLQFSSWHYTTLSRALSSISAKRCLYTKHFSPLLRPVICSNFCKAEHFAVKLLLK